MEKNRHCDVLYYILGEFETLKLDSEKFKTFLLDNTGKSSELVKEVVQGKADAALLPACFLEQHVVEYPSLYREIKVLNPLRSSELPCTVSTTLYPNWSVLITPNISMKQATDIAATLLTQPKSSDGAWWSVSTQFDGVDKLLKNLKVEQYSYLQRVDAEKILRRVFPIHHSFRCIPYGRDFVQLHCESSDQDTNQTAVSKSLETFKVQERIRACQKRQ